MSSFSLDCSLCPRLANFLTEVRKEYPSYHGLPVAPFGDPDADFLIVGLAPGMHGANATGRPFTGDFAGILLYRTLYEFGFSNQPESNSAQDLLELKNCRITNAVKCLPPQNKPIGSEIANCNGFLESELAGLPNSAIILALGVIAHKAVVKASGEKIKNYPFGHGKVHQLDKNRHLVDSYHCSRYNTQTGRLTEAMFKDVFRTIRKMTTKTE
ncbi:MAG: uracil-DNA glycosylase [Methylococcales bacterium]